MEFEGVKLRCKTANIEICIKTYGVAKIHDFLKNHKICNFIYIDVILLSKDVKYYEIS